MSSTINHEGNSRLKTILRQFSKQKFSNKCQALLSKKVIGFCTAPDFVVVDEVFSTPVLGVLSLSCAVAVVLTAATAAGGGLVAVVLLANDVTACLGVAVVLVGVGLCTVAGLAACFGGATGAL